MSRALRPFWRRCRRSLLRQTRLRKSCASRSATSPPMRRAWTTPASWRGSCPSGRARWRAPARSSSRRARRGPGCAGAELASKPSPACAPCSAPAVGTTSGRPSPSGARPPSTSSPVRAPPPPVTACPPQAPPTLVMDPLPVALPPVAPSAEALRPRPTPLHHQRPFLPPRARSA